jgi:hypothetical protein
MSFCLFCFFFLDFLSSLRWTFLSLRRFFFFLLCFLDDEDALEEDVDVEEAADANRWVGGAAGSGAAGEAGRCVTGGAGPGNVPVPTPETAPIA